MINLQMKKFQWIMISYNKKMVLCVAGLSAVGFGTMIFQPFLQGARNCSTEWSPFPSKLKVK